jgi:spore maturation protein CgeB
MTGRLKLRMFAHSWISDWNHGNAHFLRGLASELVRLGHDVRCYEETPSWSMLNLLKEGSDKAIDAVRLFWEAFPNLDVRFFSNDTSFPCFIEDELREADVVLIHEWTTPEIVSTILSLKSKLGFRALFHDTHHRAYTSPQEIVRLPLREFDGVLAFGEAIRRIYAEGFGVRHTWTFQEAADTQHFCPLRTEKDTDVLWVGNWGDEERTRELEEFLIGPASSMRDCHVAVHGVRYPAEARQKLSQAGIEYRGYLCNLKAPPAYAKSFVSLHVPRRYYSNGLSGIPTIRVFESLACGTPLVCSPWTDKEELFRAGEDYICAADGRAMEAEIRHLLRDDSARQQLASNGLETIQRRHTCAHRAVELLDIVEELGR